MRSAKIIILTYADDVSRAAYINTLRKKAILTRAGFKVNVYIHKPGLFVKDIFILKNLLNSGDLLFVRIDGSGLLDKFTLVKFLIPGVKIVWDVHGFPDENYTSQKPSEFNRLKVHWKRKLLSLFVDQCFLISKELKSFARHKIFIKRASIVHNISSINSEKKGWGLPGEGLFDDSRFIVLWGGNARLKWQALDLVEQVAQKVYAFDKSILFLVFGRESWHKFSWRKNIVFLDNLPIEEFMVYVKSAHLCLALYKKPAKTPFYFMPLKIIDYMAVGKPVLASNFGTIRSLITDGKDGVLTDNNPGDIARKIIHLKQYPSKRARIGKNAREKVLKYFSLPKASRDYVDALKPLAN